MKKIKNPTKEQFLKACQRPTPSFEHLYTQVEPIINAIKTGGDAALKSYTLQFDKVALPHLKVLPAEIEAAKAQLSDALIEAIEVAYQNIYTFHKTQPETPKVVETMPGVLCWRKSLPIQKVGLYIPGGTAPLFSTLLMLGIPAKIAGCKEIILCTPPNMKGEIHPAILFTASLLGLSNIYKVGGAQAIAAMGYGTESIPKVDKIFGPGNAYVTVAKQLMQQSQTAIDMPAGPSEVAVFADDSAHLPFIAADLLSQAEHGIDSQVLLVTTSERIFEGIENEIHQQLVPLNRKEIAEKALANSHFVLVKSADEALEFLNIYAPEHLILSSDDASALSEKVENAGSVFLGHFTPESAGDYASGTNHTLPTNGWASAYSGVSVDAFVKKVTFQNITPNGLLELGKHVQVMANAEGLDAHANAVTVRLASDSVKNIRKNIPQRIATLHRKTNETNIFISINLDGNGQALMQTGLGFFDHMLHQLARHSLCDMVVKVKGDLEIDEHHTIEDTAIALGACFLKALGDKKGIERYGFLLPMDDVLAQAAIDFSGRPWLVWEVDFKREFVGEMPTEMFYHFWKSFSDASKCNLNIKAEGENEHHKIEAIFKAVAKSIKMAVKIDEANKDRLPSTKGML